MPVPVESGLLIGESLPLWKFLSRSLPPRRRYFLAQVTRFVEARGSPTWYFVLILGFIR